MAIYPCCCVSSTIGATIIGALEIIGGLLGLIWAWITYYVIQHMKELLKDKSEYGQYLLHQTRNQVGGFDNAEQLIALLQARFIYGIVVSLASIITASMMLHGIKNKQLSLIQAYLVVSVLFYIFSIFFSIFTSPPTHRELLVIGFLITFYCLGVVCHAYVEIRSKLRAIKIADTVSAVTYTP